MKKVLGKIRDYLLYCGISKSEYEELKKDAYESNFVVWRILHVLMIVVFGMLFINSLVNATMKPNLLFYLAAFCYSTLSSVLFIFVFKKDSLIAQLYIYLSISLLFVFGAFITTHKPDDMSVTFIVLLIITPMFMIDKPYFMSIVLVIASIIFLVWMKGVKTDEAWEGDFVNTITFCAVGIFLHIISNSIRIREFVLTRKISIQKDLDDLTGLMNKGALTRNINAFLKTSVNKGILFVLDVDDFKSVNDIFGHDIGDDILRQIGEYLANKFTHTKIIGRFGGDEFIVFFEGSDDLAFASNIAREVTSDIRKYIKTPNPDQVINATIGIAIYKGDENNYSEIFKKADIALYNAKNGHKKDFEIY